MRVWFFAELKMAYIPAQLTRLLSDLTAQLPIILGRNLVGLYLYGSVAHSGFNPKRSDVDLIAVTQRDLSDAQFRKLDSWLAQTAKSNPWTTRVQMLIPTRKDIFILDSKGCLYQFGRLSRSGWDGNPIIWLDFLNTGKVLFGPHPLSFLPEITWDSLLVALKRELGYLREEISDKPGGEWRDVPMYRAYAVLTLCRILYSCLNGSITSKPKAAKWALNRVPKQLRPVIRQACKVNEVCQESDISLSSIRDFVEFVDDQLTSAP